MCFCYNAASQSQFPLPKKFAMSKSTDRYLAEHATCPPVLYKYCSIDGAEKIFQSGLRLNSVTSFNDPFDSQFVAIWPSDEIAWQRVKELTPPARWRARYQEALRRKAKYPDGDTPELREGRENMGVSCFSEDRNSILMWGHYAAEHTGVCLGVRVMDMYNSFLMSEFRHVLKKVEYSDDFPKWVVGQDDEKDVVEAMATKASCWAYEKEWRIAAIGAAAKHCRIPSDCIPYVIFGVRSEKEDEERLRDIIRRNGYAPELLKAKIAKGQYKLDISPL